MQAQLAELTIFLGNEKSKKSNGMNHDGNNIEERRASMFSSHGSGAENNASQRQKKTPPGNSLPPRPLSMEVEVQELLQNRRLQTNGTTLSNQRVDRNTGPSQDIRISKDYVKDSEGFIRRERRPRNQQRPLTMVGTRIKVAPVIKKCKIFVSRLAPHFPMEELREFTKELTGSDSCIIERLKTKFPTYSSFVITCDKQYEATLLDPDEWEEGALVRTFVGNIPRHNSSTVSERDSLAS